MKHPSVYAFAFGSVFGAIIVAASVIFATWH